MLQKSKVFSLGLHEFCGLAMGSYGNGTRSIKHELSPISTFKDVKFYFIRQKDPNKVMENLKKIIKDFLFNLLQVF